MYQHSQKINSCKCGSKVTPKLDSDDMVPCWTIKCADCKQMQHDSNWTLAGAVNKWNEHNPNK